MKELFETQNVQDRLSNSFKILYNMLLEDGTIFLIPFFGMVITNGLVSLVTYVLKGVVTFDMKVVFKYLFETYSYNIRIIIGVVIIYFLLAWMIGLGVRIGSILLIDGVCKGANYDFLSILKTIIQKFILVWEILIGSVKYYIYPVIVLGGGLLIYLYGVGSEIVTQQMNSPYIIIGVICIVIGSIWSSVVAIRLVFSYYIGITENKNGYDSLKSSWELTKGHFWQIFGNVAACGFIGGFVIGLITGVISVVTRSNEFVNFSNSYIMSPIFMTCLMNIFIFLLYKNYTNNLNVSVQSVEQISD